MEIKKGDYIYFGKYNNNPILWRVINLDNDGDPLLWSEYILCNKTYDAAESGIYGQTGENPYTTDRNRQKYGSNKWENSNIREWLNSADQKVKWTTQPPTKDAVYRNPYDTEAGFLTNFTEKEKNAIKSTQHRVLLAEIDKSEADGGTEMHEFSFDYPNDAVQNYDSSYYKRINDKVFLLGIKDLARYVQKRGYEWRKSEISQTSFSWFWTSSPCSSDSSYIRFVGSDGDINGFNASTGSGGVVPALYLHQLSAIFTAGVGSLDNPYIIEK
jgi:hypothetical protein